MFNAHEFAARLSARADRWSLLKDFIAEWHGLLEPGDGYSAAGIDAAEQGWNCWSLWANGTG